MSSRARPTTTLFGARRSDHDHHVEPLTAAVTASRNDAGNIDYEAHQVEGEPGTFVIFERWESREALDGHLRAPRMQDLVPRLLELMDGGIEDGIRFLQPFRPAR